jgi:putative ABC transport system permease protein
MNIMLVSVTERTREIGLRKAVGAHNSDIMLQFLIEALVLCVIGGLIGISISYAIAYGLSQMSFMPFPVIIETWALALALGVSSASGFIFGLYPAWQATRLDPIEALRFE